MPGYEVWVVDTQDEVSTFIEAFTDHTPAYKLRDELEAEIEDGEDIYYEVRDVH